MLQRPSFPGFPRCCRSIQGPKIYVKINEVRVTLVKGIQGTIKGFQGTKIDAQTWGIRGTTAHANLIRTMSRGGFSELFWRFSAQSLREFFTQYVILAFCRTVAPVDEVFPRENRENRFVSDSFAGVFLSIICACDPVLLAFTVQYNGLSDSTCGLLQKSCALQGNITKHSHPRLG
jgi:hypothetical protein